MVGCIERLWPEFLARRSDEEVDNVLKVLYPDSYVAVNEGHRREDDDHVPVGNDVHVIAAMPGHCERAVIGTNPPVISVGSGAPVRPNLD